MIEKLKNIAEIKLNNKNNTIEEKTKYELISKILNDEDCFQKMDIKTAYKLLEDLEFNSSEIRKIYNELFFK